ncbi:hybrid sensor histidine kinase/response regulator [Humidesulfovibrio idahonensis]
MILQRHPIVLASLAWSILVAAAAGISIYASYESTLAQARVAARVAFEKDLTFRRWNTSQGGVYVRVNERNQPNPYLDVPERDLETKDGKTLTMINPAYMSRQMYELQKHTAEVQGHITSLNPIRPDNLADPWEHEALLSFHDGVDEVFSHELIDGKPYLRIMRPVRIERYCMPCHAKQGYKEGEIRGGISVSVPLATHLGEFHALAAKTTGGYGLIWAIGLVGIVSVGKRLVRSMDQERQARQAAETASVAKSEFLANMSHEIRTPLNGVLGMLQLLKEESTPEEQASFVDMAYDSGRRLLALLNDILDFSRIEAGELVLQRQPFCTRDLLSSATNVFAATCAEHKLALIVRADDTLPAMLVGDEARLRQVLFNLLGNAIKFTPSGSVTLEAWAQPHGTDFGKVRLYLVISDTGIGIGDEMIAHVFERFTQVDGSFTRRYQGAGLGLAIVRRLVDLMGGSITVVSEKGQGTTFYLQTLLSLPEPMPSAKRCEPGTAAADKDRQLRVLLVEDEEVSRLSTKLLLERFGCSITCAGDGGEAVEVFMHSPFDCVLMDIQMPEMDGVEATRRIRAFEESRGQKPTPIIALTAYAMPGDRERFLRAGMDDHVTKPVQMDELKQSMRRVVPACRREEGPDDGAADDGRA